MDIKFYVFSLKTETGVCFLLYIDRGLFIEPVFFRELSVEFFAEAGNWMNYIECIQ